MLVLALAAINLILMLVVGTNLLQQDALTRLSSPLVSQLSQDLAALLVLGGAASLALSFSAASRKKPGGTRALANGLAWGLLGLLGIGLVVVALLMIRHYLALRGVQSGQEAAAVGIWPSWLVVAVWGLTLGASRKLRGSFVQYLGDVAIYIDADKVANYHKVRVQIRELANRTACAIYAARRPGTPAAGTTLTPFLYERVIIVGHSLGTLIAYDLLNAALVLDETLRQRLQVQERTRALVTFGSPLDKTAYIFHFKQPKNSLRAVLRASVQPLTRSIAARQAIGWANIYSPADFISGRLQFYDYPFQDPTPRRGAYATCKTPTPARRPRPTPSTGKMTCWPTPLPRPCLPQPRK